QRLRLPSLLEEDIFERFVITCGVYSHAFCIDTGHLLGIHFIAELVKISMGICESEDALRFIRDDSELEQHHGLPLFLYATAKTEYTDGQLGHIYHLMRRFILPFLRKAVMFTHVYEGVVFPHADDGYGDTPECDRLCRLLGL